MTLIDGLKKYFKEHAERRQKFKMKNVKVQRNINENIHVHYFEIGVMLGMICFMLIGLCFLIWFIKFRMIWGL